MVASRILDSIHQESTAEVLILVLLSRTNSDVRWVAAFTNMTVVSALMGDVGLTMVHPVSELDSVENGGTPLGLGALETLDGHGSNDGTLLEVDLGSVPAVVCNLESLVELLAVVKGLVGQVTAELVCTLRVTKTNERLIDTLDVALHCFFVILLANAMVQVAASRDEVSLHVDCAHLVGEVGFKNLVSQKSPGRRVNKTARYLENQVNQNECACSF